MNFSDNRLRVFLNAGIWASYNVGAYEWVKSGNTVTEGPYHMTLVKDNPLGYGLLGGIGLNVVMGKWELMLEGRYYFSYGDIMRNSAVYAAIRCVRRSTTSACRSDSFTVWATSRIPPCRRPGMHASSPKGRPSVRSRSWRR